MPSPKHVIRPVRGSKIPSLCVFLDTETRPGPGSTESVSHETFRLAVAVKVQRERGKWGRRELCRFSRPDSLWDWIHGLESKRRPVWVFAHNLGFDLTVSGFWEHVCRKRWSTRDVWAVAGDSSETGERKQKPWRGTMVVTDPPTIVAVRSRAGSLRLVDTFNYFRGSVDDMGRSAGLDKIARPDPAAPDAEWFNYCRRDVEILERTVCKWLDEWANLDCGSWQSTAAGLGAMAWRACLNGTKVVVDHSERQISYARGAYYGGQTEVFYRGEITSAGCAEDGKENQNQTVDNGKIRGPVWHVDVHALYPSVMRERLYPFRFVGFDSRLNVERLETRAKFQLPIAYVTIASETETYPVRRNGKYMHAVGCFNTFLAGPELLPAIARGHVKHVYGVCWYQGADLFSRFVGKWIERRHRHESEGDEVAALLDKMVVNSISGKLAQHRIAWVDRPDLAAMAYFGEWNLFDRETKKLSRFRAIAGCTQEYTHQGESRDSFPAISAFITSAGRERMRQLRALCPPRTVLYQDTDSLFLLPAAVEALQESGEIGRGQLGKLQVVDRYSSLEIRGFKFYGNEDFIVCPGLKKDARELRPGTWNQSRFQRLADKLASYAGPFIEVRSQDFAPVGSLGNRLEGNDGWTLPPRVWEEEAVKASVEAARSEPGPLA